MLFEVSEELPIIRKALEYLTVRAKLFNCVFLALIKRCNGLILLTFKLEHRESIAPRRSIPDQEKTLACLASLEPTDQEIFLTEKLSCSKQACRWFSKTSEYASWYDGTKSDLLLVTARAGCGKTTLAAHVSQWVVDSSYVPSHANVPGRADVQSDIKTGAVSLSFFFSKSNWETEGTATSALRTIVSQLVHQISGLMPILLRRYNFLSARGSFSWTWDTLWSTFSEMIAQRLHHMRLYVILDGIDECDSDSRQKLLTRIKTLVENRKAVESSESGRAVLKFLITSRPDGCVIDNLFHFPGFEIKNSDTAMDMQILIQTRIQSYAQRRHLGKGISNRISQFLEDNAHGMFLWVVLIIEELGNRGKALTDETINSKLSSIPLTLGNTYEAILNNTEPGRRADLWRILRWLLFGRRGLTLGELETALWLEMPHSRWLDFHGEVMVLCGSLLRFDGQRGELNLIHQTARDFLESFVEGARPDEVGGVGLDIVAANAHLAETCVEYLLQDGPFCELEKVLRSKNAFRDYAWIIAAFLRDHPFICYAIENWSFHIRAVEEPQGPLVEKITQLLSSQKRRDGIMRLTYVSILE